jgi:hypothetical protein
MRCVRWAFPALLGLAALPVAADVLFSTGYYTVGGSRTGPGVGENFTRTLAEYQADGPIGFEYSFDWVPPGSPALLPELRSARGESSPGLLRASAAYEKVDSFLLPVPIARVAASAESLDTLTVDAGPLNGQGGTLRVRFRVEGQADSDIWGPAVTGISEWELTVGSGTPGSGSLATHLNRTGISSGRTSLFPVNGVYPYIAEPQPDFGGSFDAEIPVIFGQAFTLNAAFVSRVEFRCQWQDGQGTLQSAFYTGVTFAVVGAQDAQGGDLGLAGLAISSETGHDYTRFPAAICPPDFNDDNTLNFFDVSAFILAFNSGEARADFNLDGQINFFDVSAFVQAFNAGCP